MGRVLKRVEANFNWPLGKVWEGFLMPEELHSKTCPYCQGTGYNEETNKISESFYDSKNCGVTWHYDYGFAPDGSPASKAPWRIIGKTTQWCSDITQDEVQVLVDKNRLYDFTHTWSPESGWVRREDGYIPTAQEVNYWNEHNMGHDGINRHYLIEARAKRLGVYGLCECCNGSGVIFKSEKHKEENEAWEAKELPIGDWWQVWENVSEGSPITPAFATKEELVDYLVNYGEQGSGEVWRREAAEKFVGVGHAFSMVVKNNEVLDGSKDCDKY